VIEDRVKICVSPLRDLITNVDHGELDRRTMLALEVLYPEVPSKEQKLKRQELLFKMVIFIIIGDTRLVDFEVHGDAYHMMHLMPGLPYFSQLLEDCYEKRSFKEIRQLGANHVPLCFGFLRLDSFCLLSAFTEIFWPKLSHLAQRHLDMTTKLLDFPNEISEFAKTVPTKICVVLSLIRHAQVGNFYLPAFFPSDLMTPPTNFFQRENQNLTPRVHGIKDDDDPLTSYGRIQAEALGEQWSNVHIDCLYSSDLSRALDTAREISKHNVGKPQIQEDPELREQNMGRDPYLFQKELHRFDDCDETSRRRYKLNRFTESYEEVCRRAQEFVKDKVLGRFGVCRFDSPENVRMQKPEALPEGLPHVVIVSHNVFMTELYEGLLCWNRKHIETSAHWKVASW
jgi:broad specificity phosphatase PhoE